VWIIGFCVYVCVPMAEPAIHTALHIHIPYNLNLKSPIRQLEQMSAVLYLLLLLVDLVDQYHPEKKRSE
jgi:hypothetical protein